MVDEPTSQLAQLARLQSPTATFDRVPEAEPQLQQLVPR